MKVQKWLFYLFYYGNGLFLVVGGVLCLLDKIEIPISKNALFGLIVLLFAVFWLCNFPLEDKKVKP